MTSKSEVEIKVAATEKACREAQAAWSAAAEALSGGVGVNGYGIFYDPSQLRDKLMDARSHIDGALAVLERIDWPTRAEYDHL
jgi:hypothetical protein